MQCPVCLSSCKDISDKNSLFKEFMFACSEHFVYNREPLRGTDTFQYWLPFKGKQIFCTETRMHVSYTTIEFNGVKNKVKGSLQNLLRMNNPALEIIKASGLLPSKLDNMK